MGYAEQAVMAQIAYECDALLDIGGLEPMLEVNGHAGLPGGDLEQGLVEPMPRDRVDQFTGPLPVGLKGSAAVGMMNEPAAHRQHGVLDVAEHSREPQGMYAAIRQGQIDGPA